MSWDAGACHDVAVGAHIAEPIADKNSYTGGVVISADDDDDRRERPDRDDDSPRQLS